MLRYAIKACIFHTRSDIDMLAAAFFIDIYAVTPLFASAMLASAPRHFR